jgi:hypothetical protein
VADGAGECHIRPRRGWNFRGLLPLCANLGIASNQIGFGGRAAFNASHHVQIEGAMNYDFERNFTTACDNCISSSLATTRLRPLTGLLGPKFETPGPFKFLVTGKVYLANGTHNNLRGDLRSANSFLGFFRLV